MYSKTHWEPRNSPPNDPASRHLLNNIEDGIEQAHNFIGNGPNAGSSFAVWEDLRFPAESLKAAGVKDPAYNVFSGGLRAYWFSPTTQEELYVAAQMPHAWNGLSIYPHVHWLATTASSDAAHQVRWGIEYTWASIGSTIPGASTVYASTSFPNEQTEANKHYITSFAAITPTTNQNGMSSMLMVRLFRDSTVAGDSFTHGAFLLEFDLHYQIHMVGSRQEYVK